jgi:hypothetical protein
MAEGLGADLVMSKIVACNRKDFAAAEGLGVDKEMM